MKLIIISGRSGSGKSTAIQVLEDLGYYCIDNLPTDLLLHTTDYLINSADACHDKIALCIDARNASGKLDELAGILRKIQDQYSDIEVDFIYLDTSDEVLIQRFSATRRRHPMDAHASGLNEAIVLENEILAPLSDMASLRVDTTRMSLYELRDVIKVRVCERRQQSLSLQFTSFGFKYGVPLDSDIVYDLRILPNPYWVPELRHYNGTEQPIVEFLSRQTDVCEMVDDIKGYLEKWLPHFKDNNRRYVTVALGCTGGHHRSVFVAEKLAAHFNASMDSISLSHRELGPVHP
ncbi:MAG: RNase adapter RapZ [Pseudomonadales bacterium]